MAAPTISTCIEGPGGLPVVASSGLNTLQNINFNSGSNSCDLPAATTLNGVAISAQGNITSASTTATAFSITNSVAYTGTHVFAVIADSLTTGTAQTISVAAQTDGVALGITGGGVNISSTGIVASITGGANTDGSVLKVASTGAYVGTVGVLALASAATTGVSAAFVNSALTTGKGLNITSSGASQTSAVVLAVTQSATATGFTGSVVSITSSSTTGSGNALLVTGVNTTAGDTVKVVNNAITVGTGTLVNLSHTTSVLGAGTSMLRITSTSADTGSTTGTLLDLAQTGVAAGNVAVLLTDSSSSVAARTDVKISVTNSAAVGVIPLSIKNVAVTGTGSKFIKLIQFSEGVKISTLWLSIDATTPDGNLTGAVGDICFNGPSGRSFYNNNGTTGWTASNA